MMDVEIEKTLMASRAARRDVNDLRLRSQHARLALQWHRVEAKRQMARLDATIEALAITISQVGINRPPRVEWTRVEGAFDDVLVPVD